jgi:hypothetical protein
MQATTIRNDRGGWRWEWDALPAAGAELVLNDGRQVRYLGLGPCGMLEVEDEADGAQFLLMPHMVAGVAA